MTAGTAILKNKMALNVNATMDPYALNANGTRINEFNLRETFFVQPVTLLVVYLYGGGRRKKPFYFFTSITVKYVR